MSNVDFLVIGAAIGSTTTLLFSKLKDYLRKTETKVICVLNPYSKEGKINPDGPNGVVRLRSIGSSYTEFVCDIQNLAPGKHGFHVHEYGDLRLGCESTCSHYNPDNTVHGSATSRVRHKGDLGNIISDENWNCKSRIVANVCLTSIIGRALVVHKDEDDLGTNDTVDSKSTGSSGERIACGVIVHSK